MLKIAEEMGYRFKTGCRTGIFPVPHDDERGLLPLVPYDNASYFDISDDFSQGIRRKKILTLLALGIRVDSAHNEIGSGQHEIDLDYHPALTSADQVLTARVALRDDCAAERAALHVYAAPVD